MFGLALRFALGGLRTWLIYNANQADFEKIPELCLCPVFGMNPFEFSHVLDDAHIISPTAQWRTKKIEEEYSLVIFPAGFGRHADQKGLRQWLTLRDLRPEWDPAHVASARPTLGPKPHLDELILNLTSLGARARNQAAGMC